MGESKGVVLVVEDDELSRDATVEILRHSGYTAIAAATGEDALRLAAAEPPDLVLLDLRLPGADGYEVLRRLRAVRDVPVMILSGLISPEEKALGLRLGADDYLGKPFDPVELLARVEARLRPARTRRVLTVGPVRLDLLRREAFVRDEPVNLTNRQFDVLALLAGDPGRAFSREEILREVWGTEFVTKRNVNEQVRLLRARLTAHGVDADIVQTATGLGYRVADPSTL